MTSTRDSTETQILRGAARAFGELGYRDTSVASILEAAGVSRRTFYRFFRNRDDVLETLFRNSVRILLKAVRTAIAEHTDPYERAEASVEAFLRVHAQSGPLARVLLLEQFREGSPLLKHRQDAEAAFMELIASAHGDGPVDPILLHGIVAAHNQIAARMAEEYRAEPWDIERAKRAMMCIMRALEPPP